MLEVPSLERGFCALNFSVEEPQQVSLVSPKWPPGHTRGQEWEL